MQRSQAGSFISAGRSSWERKGGEGFEAEVCQGHTVTAVNGHSNRRSIFPAKSIAVATSSGLTKMIKMDRTIESKMSENRIESSAVSPNLAHLWPHRIEMWLVEPRASKCP